MLPGPEEEAQASDQVRRFLGTSVPVIPFSSSWLESGSFLSLCPVSFHQEAAVTPVVYFHDFNEILTQTNDKICPFDLNVLRVSRPSELAKNNSS